MKNKSTIFLFILIFYSGIILLFPQMITFKFFLPNSPSFGIIINIFLYFILIVLGIYFRFEESAVSSKELTFIAIYSTFTAVARIPFLPFPSIQPCTFLIICSGLVFGPLIGFMVGANTAILSNFIAGQGPWTIYQIIAWGLIGFSFGGLRKWWNRRLSKPNHKGSIFLLCWFGFVTAFFYGTVMNIWAWLMLPPPFTVKGFLAVYISSFPYDLAHAIANVIFLYYFGEKTVRILLRYQQRFGFTVLRANLAIEGNKEEKTGANPPKDSRE